MRARPTTATSAARASRPAGRDRRRRCGRSRGRCSSPRSGATRRPRAALEQAGEFVPVEQAERRNLILVNPVEGNIYATSRNIVSAYQMVKSGEKARSHRHTAAALRLVVEAAPGTCTVVDGARVEMRPGDVVLTPSWCWHGHANDSGASSYWIDFLDVPFVQHAEAMFFEANPDGLRGGDARSAAVLSHSGARGARSRQRCEDDRDRQGRAADHRASSDASAGRRPARDAQDDRQSSLFGDRRTRAHHGRSGWSRAA